LNAGRHLPLLAVCTLFALVTLSCGRESESSAASVSSSSDANAVIVPVVSVSRSNLQSNLVLTGDFLPYQEIDVMAKEAGYIKSIRVDIGDHVRVGELLAELQIPEMQNDSGQQPVRRLRRLILRVQRAI